VRIVPFEIPLAPNPAPVTVTLETVMFEFPLFVIDVASELLVPSPTLPKDRLLGFAPSKNVAAEPVPDKLMTSGEGVPFVVNVMLPVTGFAEDGVKTASNVVLPPAAIVVDVDNPVWLKPVPDTLICENVRVALPLFLSVIGCELLLPSATVPKLTLDGLAEICAWVPVPLNAIFRGEPAPVFVTEIVPVAAPEAVGVNVTLNEAV